MLTLGNKIIAGSFKAGASWEVGDVGISAFGIDEALNKRRYLNGQVISQAQFVQFTAMLKSRVSVYPNLATTEVNWQAEVTASVLGQCGKFVIDDVAGTIRLPKVVNINGLQNLTGLGGIKAESLPNITGQINNKRLPDDGAFCGYEKSINNIEITGAFKLGSYNDGVYSSGNSIGSRFDLDFDASRSSSTYQNNAPVQQEAVQYPYFIQVATGVETSIDVSREIELNNPFSLLDYKYSEYELSNASWLLSNGQWNSGAVYQSVYDLLLQIYNGTVTKAGVSVKLSTETYADTDFVLNTGDTTFRLPLKVALASGKAVVGNGHGMALTTSPSTDQESTAATHYIFENGDLTGASGTVSTPLANGTSISGAGGFANNQVIGLSPNPTLSGIETSANGLYLYFYVGETVQDANIIAAAGVLTDVADLKNASNFSSLGKETVVGWGMPSDDYVEYDCVNYGQNDFTAPFDGIVCVICNNSENAQAVIDLWSKDEQGNTLVHQRSDTYTGGQGGACWIPCRKNQNVCVYIARYSGIRKLRFVKLKGNL